MRQTIEHAEIGIATTDVTLPGDLAMPPHAHSVVIFAHGSGSSRLSPRNRFVADHLNDAGFATMLFDLLTADEDARDDESRALRFDIPFLADRLTGVIDWLARYHPTEGMRYGLFGASTGAAAALITAGERPGRIDAVVSRGGRPDLAADALERVRAPTLLIVGQRDPVVLDLNQQAAGRLRCKHAVEIVPQATHLFVEPGSLEHVAQLAAAWFAEHLGAGEWPAR